MSEANVGYLFNISGILSQGESSHAKTLLKSYYLMRCRENVASNKLPKKHFSAQVRCQRCSIEWKSNSEITVTSLKLNKRQKRRKQSKRGAINKIVQVCTFCKNGKIIIAHKPKTEIKFKSLTIKNPNMKAMNEETTGKKQTTEPIKTTANMKKKPEINVYSNALDIFSLTNKSNTLAKTVKEQPKVIKNNKKKKDKFAGLCQKAVLASTKLKEEKANQNKLNLFLKPST